MRADDTIDKIKGTAQRIARLGAYLSNPYGPTANKEKGLLYMTRDVMHPLMLMCNLRSGRVWEHEIGTGSDYDPPNGLERLTVFDREITEAVQRQLKEEVLADLIEKRLRRITKTKSRGFKADLKRLKGKKKRDSQHAAHG
jgi:hypothetical protein